MDFFLRFCAVLQGANRRERGRALRSAGGIGLLFFCGALALTGCRIAGVGATGSPKSPQRMVLTDDAAKCPMNADSGTVSTWNCSLHRGTNGRSGNFSLPFKPWGVTYAYNCGKKADDLQIVVGMSGVDGRMPDTFFERVGRQGRGYVVETGKGIQEWKSVPPYWRNPVDLMITTPCAWHTRVVLGTASVLARYVPPIPGPNGGVLKPGTD